MYFPDLTPYQYGRTEPQPNVLNVGWLSAAQSFRRGDPDESFVNALQRLVLSAVNLYRGYHLCEFCHSSPIEALPNGFRVIEPLPGTRGNGEIRVTGANGITYVAPVLVIHYVVAHSYLPPQEFVDAVTRAAST
jgi:hypothetical protein